MKIISEKLISDLIERTRKNLNDAEDLALRSLDDLNWKSNANSWSALECIEHLNLYGEFYLPEIERAISRKKYKAEHIFKSGLLGNYFAKSMLPKEKLNKMKTFKDKNPRGRNLDKAVIDRFIIQQQKMLELLDSSRKTSLTDVKTGVSISKWIKLRLGDTFRVVIYHNQRHLLQAFKALEQKKLVAGKKIGSPHLL